MRERRNDGKRTGRESEERVRTVIEEEGEMAEGEWGEGSEGRKRNMRHRKKEESSHSL